LPKDDLGLPRLLPAALSPEVRALLKSQNDQLTGLGALLKSQNDQLTGLGTLLPPTRWSHAVIALKQRQLVERRQAIEALERQRDAIERKIASERQAARAIEAELARVGVTPDPSAPAAPSSPAVSAAADPSPTPEPERIGSAPDEEQQDGPQAELTRLFFQEVYPGGPPKKMGYRRLRERMEDWVVEKNTLDHGSRIAASETTIRRVRNAL
jgi:hypothetical protein